jgi:hypothetical protein
MRDPHSAGEGRAALEPVAADRVHVSDLVHEQEARENKLIVLRGGRAAQN